MDPIDVNVAFLDPASTAGILVELVEMTGGH